MKVKKLVALLMRYFRGYSSEEETDALRNWQKESDEHKQLLEEFCNPRKLAENMKTFNHFSAKKGWFYFERTHNIIAYRRNLYVRALRVAAVLVFIVSIGGGIYLINTKQKEGMPLASIAPVMPGSSSAILHIDEQCIFNISDTLTARIQGENALIANIDKGEIAFNETLEKPVPIIVEVPSKAEYRFSLPDNTEVWMNAGSKICFTFPFGDDIRSVYAEGEVYFEVAKEKNRPFIVNLPNKSAIEVLGTEFSVNTYEGKEKLNTALVEGSILWKNTKGIEHVLKPGQLLSENGLTGEVQVKDVEDIYQYIAWKDGRFVFKGRRLEEIINSFSHWYGVEFVYVDEQLKDRRFSVDVKRYENLNSILHMLELTEIVYFTCNESNILIHKR